MECGEVERFVQLVEILLFRYSMLLSRHLHRMQRSGIACDLQLAVNTSIPQLGGSILRLQDQKDQLQMGLVAWLQTRVQSLFAGLP